MSSDPTLWDLAMEAIEDHGCDCDGDPENIADHTCIAGRCEHALLTERAARDEARKERDAALAEVARLRVAADAVPVSAGGRGLVWVEGNGGWRLCPADDPRLAATPYTAWLDGTVKSYKSRGASRDSESRCAGLRAAVREIASMARADGHTVPPHPLGWDVGVSDG